MTDQNDESLRKALRDALKGTPLPFAQADKDLRGLVGRISQVVESETGGRAWLDLRPIGTTDEGPDYFLVAVIAEGDGSTQDKKLAAINVPYEGYPIRIDDDRTLEQKDQIDLWLREMVSDPDSPLVRYLAFWKWRAENFPTASPAG